MCGFFQVIHRQRPVDSQAFQAALDSIQHRGPDDSGQRFHDWTANTNSGPLTLHAASGHRRLAILDLNPRSRQPFGDDGCSLLYNGELYNFQQFRDELRSECDFQTTGDTEVLYQLLRRSSTSRLAEFNGMWAFTLLNEADGTLTASRDRYGKKPLFYYQDDETLCFSSSIQAIQIYLGRTFQFERQALLGYLLYGTMYPRATTQSHFEGINQVLPGEVCHFDLKSWSCSRERHFDPGQCRVDDLDEPGLLAQSLKEGVTARLVSDRPVALLLSGGVDSSLLLSVLCSLGLQDQVHVYLGDTGRSDDYEYGRRCAEQVGVKAKTVRLDYSENMFNRFLNVCKHHEKAFPFSGNALAMPEMYEAISADNIPVVLDGTGGDEFFGGYWGRQLPFAVRQERKLRTNSWTRSLRKASSKTNQVAQHLRAARTPKSIARMIASLQPPLSMSRHGCLKLSFRELFSTPDPDPLSQPGDDYLSAVVADIAPGGRLGEWVWHNDRNAMMHSVENRSPLLDPGLHAFLFRSYRDKYVDEFNKYELRSVFDHFVNLPTQWRSQKQGFRWDGKAFLKQNENSIRDLIAAGQWLRDVVDVPKFVDLSLRRPSTLRSTLAKRILCISGIEAGMSTVAAGSEKTSSRKPEPPVITLPIRPASELEIASPMKKVA